MAIIYQPSRDWDQYQRRFQVAAVASAEFVSPTEQGMFIRRPRLDRAGERPVSRFEASTGRWGLIPLFAGDRDYPGTFEARAETVSFEPDFLQPWKRGHRCIVLADALYRQRANGSGVVRVARADGQPLALAGLWNGWRSPEGMCVESFALLTLPSEERRGERWIVFLRDGWIEDWLHCAVEEAGTFLRPFDSRLLVRTVADVLPTSIPSTLLPHATQGTSPPAAACL